MKLTMVVLVGVILGAAPANAAVSVASRRAMKCAEAKIRAVRKKVDAKLTCQGIAVRKGTTVNLLCIANAEAAFLKAFARAEAKGGCFNPNGESETRTESRINDFIADIGGLLIPCSPSPAGTPCGPSDCSGSLTVCVPDVSGAPVCADTTNCRLACTSDAACEPGRACVTVLGENRCCDICE
jgi:hypothetical protein